jgi:Cu/Ag efflux pump CusA
MMRAIVGSSLKLRALVLGIADALVVIGVTQLRHAPVDVLPEFTPTYVEIQTEALGLSANEVEELITAPMEADLLRKLGLGFASSTGSFSKVDRPRTPPHAHGGGGSWL